MSRDCVCLLSCTESVGSVAVQGTVCTAVHSWCLTLPTWSPLYPCTLPWECLSSDPYPTLHAEDLHVLVRVMQCFGSLGMGALCQAHVSGVRSTCELFVPRGESEPRGGLGCAQDSVQQQGAGQGVSKACLHTGPGSARVTAACSLCVFPAWSILPFFSCYPFDLYCKQVALTDSYPLQKAKVSKGSVNNSPMSVWTAPVLSAFPS